MKKICFSLIGIVALGVLFTSCKKVVLDGGDLTEDVRELDEDFSKIHISGSLDLFINQDDSDDVLRIEAGENLIEHIETYVQDGTLFIEEESNNFFTSSIRRVYVSKEVLEEITMVGSGDLEADELISAEFNLNMEGSGDSDIEFAEASDVSVTMDGSGDCEVKGEGNSFILGLNGSGDCNARFLEVAEATININGSGDVEVYANEDLVININGSGDVNYWGTPAGTLFNINGSGDINGND